MYSHLLEKPVSDRLSAAQWTVVDVFFKSPFAVFYSQGMSSAATLPSHLVVHLDAIAPGRGACFLRLAIVEISREG